MIQGAVGHAIEATEGHKAEEIPGPNMLIQNQSACYVGSTLEEGKNGSQLAEYCSSPSKK